MTETLSLAKFSLNNSTNKEKIVHILSQKWPLSTKQVFEQLTKEYSTEISYQAVHKSLTELENEKTIEKEQKGWKLKKEWLQKGEQFFQKSLEKYNGAINRYDIPANFEGTLTFEFDSFTDFCVKTAELFTSKLLTGETDSKITVVSEYGYWPIKFNFDHFGLLYKMMKNCPKSKFLMKKDTSFGRWILKQYERTGIVCAPIGTKVDMQDDLIIQGNNLLEINFSEKSKEIIQKYWIKWNNINDALIDFGLKKEPEMRIKVKITKNSNLAEFLNKGLEKYFEV